MKKNSEHSIDRLLIAGSFGKRTNISQSDADCVVFINDQKPPFDQITKEFYEICNKPEVRNLFNSFSIKMNRNSINLKINGLEMDVVPATNFVKDLKKHQSLPHVQQREVLEYIKRNPTEYSYKFSSSLAEATVYFMKTRVGFANEIARIAKYWFKNLGNDLKDISGASTFIETVAVHAARKGRLGNRKHYPYLKAFMRFLEKLVNFETLDVSFKRCNPVFKQHPPGNSAIPRVIDPVNPYNNLAENWSGKNIDTLKNCAAMTLARIQQMVLTPSQSASGRELDETLFH